MDRWEIIRQRAAAVIAQYEARAGRSAFDEHAGSYARLREIARTVYQLSVVPDDELPERVSGRLDPEERTIGYRAGEQESRQHWTVAHELGHHALGHPPREALEPDDVIDEVPDVGDLAVRDGIYRAYSEHDRFELEANVFAAELLAPVARVRAMVLGRPDWTVEGLAAYFGLSRAAILNQLAAALLPGPAADMPGTAVPSTLPPLDPLQDDAVTVPTPTLVLAGPGAGKTRVLTERFAHLVRSGAEPARILALTFANKAAAEMRERLTALLPAHAHAIQVGTFHALGLELLQSYGHAIGLGPDPRLITEIDAFVLLRSRLGELPLGVFEDLHRPTRHLRTVLSAISRAKDELASPAHVAELADAWQAALDRQPAPDSGDDTDPHAQERGQAARAHDVAAVYAVYQGWLREAGYLDYGDLIAEVLHLFEVPPIAAAIRARYDHILVDEFQDINYASGRLVQALDGGRGIVWAVGDPRQSIYRFRGASPVNLQQFATDYPGARIVPLVWNYRSVEDIVRAGQAVPIPHPAGDDPLPVPELRSSRGRASDGPAVELVVAATGKDELADLVEHVAATARRRPYGEIAVLCRTRTQARDVSDALEAASIPTDWGGALEDRATFKNLIGVLLLAADDPQGLVRLARLPEHYLDEADLRRLLAVAPERGGSAQAALYAARDGEVEGLTAEGQAQADRLRRLAGALGHQPTPWYVIASYVFEHASWVRTLLGDTTPAVQRRLSTLGQLAGLVRDFAARAALAGSTDTRAFLDFLHASMEAGELGTSDDALTTSAAVHVLTVHRSKGLEWPAVFVPNLAQSRFPLDGDRTPLPLPPGLVHGEDALADEVEEACLFYVAVTRARDELTLSRAERYSRNTPDPAAYLDHLVDALQPSGYLRLVAAPSLLPAAPESSTERPDGWAFTGAATFRDLETYEDCPKRFQYERVYRLGSDERGYLSFHNAVYAVMSWAAACAAVGDPPDPAAAVAKLAARWADTGLAEHWFGAAYRRRAERILQTFAGRLRPGQQVAIRHQVPLQLGNRTLVLTVDELEEIPDGRRIWRRHHFGHPAQSHHKTDHHPALFTAAHAQHYGATPYEVRLYYPMHDRDEPAAPTAQVIRNRTTKMVQLMGDIEVGRFPPKPSSERCSTCPFVFICPS